MHFADKGAQAKATQIARCIDSNGVQDGIPIGTDHGGLRLQQFFLYRTMLLMHCFHV